MRKIGVEEWIFRGVMLMYVVASMQVRVSENVSEEFSFNVVIHQVSVL